MLNRSNIYRTKDAYYNAIKDETEISEANLDVAFQAVCESIYQTVKNEVWNGNVKQIESLFSKKISLSPDNRIVQQVKDKFSSYMTTHTDMTIDMIDYLSDLIVVPLVSRTRDIYLEINPDREIQEENNMVVNP